MASSIGKQEQDLKNQYSIVDLNTRTKYQEFIHEFRTSTKYQHMDQKPTSVIDLSTRNKFQDLQY
jgi:hypothetical protein